MYHICSFLFCNYQNHGRFSVICCIKRGWFFLVCLRVIEQLKHKLSLIDLFFQDNDSKHTSRSTKAWMEQAGIINSVMKTPASFHDLNPIENVWAGIKTFQQSTAKPKTKEELVSGIRSFWRTLTARQCARYIDHVHRVIPQVIMNNGEATNF